MISSSRLNGYLKQAILKERISCPAIGKAGEFFGGHKHVIKQL